MIITVCQNPMGSHITVCQNPMGSRCYAPSPRRPVGSSIRGRLPTGSRIRRAHTSAWLLHRLQQPHTYCVRPTGSRAPAAISGRQFGPSRQYASQGEMDRPPRATIRPGRGTRCVTPRGQLGCRGIREYGCGRHCWHLPILSSPTATRGSVKNPKAIAARPACRHKRPCSMGSRVRAHTRCHRSSRPSNCPGPAR